MRRLHTCSPNTEPSAESAKVKNSDKSQLPSVASWLGDSESVSLVSTAVSLLQSSLQARGECSLFCFFFFCGWFYEDPFSAVQRQPWLYLIKCQHDCRLKNTRDSYIIPCIQNANGTESKSEIFSFQGLVVQKCKDR